jgi:hypothetical protein
MQLLLGWFRYTPPLLRRRNPSAAPKRTLRVKIEGVYNYLPGRQNISISG